ncbi:hypothetical protein A7A09_008580 [Paracoccus methylarcula]|uniref:Bacterial Ig-like domain-containing protein n=2 Tax=Paracoccus methylarcula TaxID=72022 RepID=A0A3R7LQ62_9RHOB|nr:hypothetical protein A7A09_008580 [Paracoccus methylarcula]
MTCLILIAATGSANAKVALATLDLNGTEVNIDGGAIYKSLFVEEGYIFSEVRIDITLAHRMYSLDEGIRLYVRPPGGKWVILNGRTHFGWNYDVELHKTITKTASYSYRPQVKYPAGKWDFSFFDATEVPGWADPGGHTYLDGSKITILGTPIPPPPEVEEITSTVSGLTNLSSLPVNVKFSKDVEGFVSGDISTTNATVGPVSGSGRDYSFNLMPSGDGGFTVGIKANAVIDAYDQGNMQSGILEFVFDHSAPVAEITSTETGPTAADIIPVTVTFSEAVTEVDITDISVSNATRQGVTDIGNNSYIFTLEPFKDGEVTAWIPASGVTDSAGNYNGQSETFRIISDRSAPVAEITSTETGPTAADIIPVTVTFSEAVTEVDINAISVSNATKQGVTDNLDNSYIFTLKPSKDGEVTAWIPATRVTDGAGNGNGQSETFRIISDRSAPVPKITSTEVGPTAAASIPVTLTFSDKVTGFDAEELMVKEAEIANFDDSANPVFTFNLVLPAGKSGSASVGITRGAATNLAGLMNEEGASFAIAYDRIVPTVTIAAEVTSPSNAARIPVTVTFSKPVSEFTGNHVMLTGAGWKIFLARGRIMPSTWFQRGLEPSPSI